MKRSTISVVIPCFNSGAYLDETLKSLFAQTRRPDEIIIVDDGSTDKNTIAALERVPAPVKVLRQQNQGPGAARNQGVRASTGALIFPLDSDDLIVPAALDKYERALLAAPEASFANSHVELFGATEGDFAVPRFNGYLEMQENYCVSTALIRREVFTDRGIWYPTSGGYEDWSFWLSCVEAGLRGVVVEERLFRYRRKAGEGVLFEHNQKQQRFRHAIRERHAQLYSAEGRVRIKAVHAPGLEVLWRGASEGRRELDVLLARQSLADVSVTEHAPKDARGYLDVARGKYALELGDVDLDRLRTARPSFLEQVVRLLESRHKMNAAVVPVDAATIFAARDNERVFRCPRERERSGDLVFFRVASARNSTRLLLRPGISVRQLFRVPIHRGRALVSAYEYFGQLGDAPPHPIVRRVQIAAGDDQIIWKSPVRYARPIWRVVRAGAVAMFGEEATARRVHGWKLRVEDMVLRGLPIPSIGDAIPTIGAALPESRRVELMLLNQVPVRFERPTPLASTAGKKRLAYILPWITTGGVDRGAIDVASLLPSDRYELMLITQYRSRHEWEHRMLPHLIDAVHLGDSVPQPEQVARVVQMVGDRCLDGLIMSNSWLGYEAAMATKRRFPGVRTVDLQHTDFQRKGGDFARQSCKRYDGYLDLRLVTHNYLRNRYVKYGVDAGKIRVVYMSCDDQGTFNPERVTSGWLHEQLRLPYGALIVGFIGRLVPDKSPVFVTRVYAALQQQWSDLERPLHFVFLGEGRLAPAIRKEAEMLGIGRQVHFLPADTPVQQAMRDMALVLMASRIEGLPFVFFEAMSLGVPVVSTRIEGIPELVDETVGACVPNYKKPVQRLDALRTAALPILENRELRQEMAARARQKVLTMCSREHTRTALVAAFADLFDRRQPALSLAVND